MFSERLVAEAKAREACLVAETGEATHQPEAIPEAEHERRARHLVQAIELAEALPYRPSLELRYPQLPSE